MTKNWYMMLKKYRPVIKEIYTEYEYPLTMETENEIYFIGDDGEEVYMLKNEEHVYFEYISRGREFETK